jgi:gamma-glutamyltranspeptidase/glutathione hydrolase
LQVLVNLIDFKMDVQQAGETPRFRHAGQEVLLESAFGEPVRSGLAKKGHHVASAVDAWGGYQGILIDPDTGVLMGGSDPRKDGLAIGW